MRVPSISGERPYGQNAALTCPQSSGICAQDYMEKPAHHPVECAPDISARRLKNCDETLWTPGFDVAIRPPMVRRSSAVEQLTVNQLVVGSIPTAGAIKNPQVSE